MGECATSLRPEYAEAVRVVDHQPGVEAFGEFEERGQRRQVAVHAEHGVGEDQFAFGRARAKHPFERREIAMWIALAISARELHGVDQ